MGHRSTVADDRAWVSVPAMEHDAKFATRRHRGTRPSLAAKGPTAMNPPVRVEEFRFKN